MALAAGPPLLLAAAWRKGKRRGRLPGWLATNPYNACQGPPMMVTSPPRVPTAAIPAAATPGVRLP